MIIVITVVVVLSCGKNARPVENHAPRGRRRNRFFGFNQATAAMTSLAEKNPSRASSHPGQRALTFFAPANESVVLATTTAVVVIYVDQTNILYRSEELARFSQVHAPRNDNNNIWRTTTESAC